MSSPPVELFVDVDRPLLDEMLRRWWSRSDLDRRFEMTIDAFRVPAAKAAVVLECPSLELDANDCGEIRLSCGAVLSLRGRFPGARRRLGLRWKLTARLRLDVGEGLGAPAALVCDFAAARVHDPKVRAIERPPGWLVDPLEMDPFSGRQLAELGRLAIDRVLERVGERRVELDPRAAPEAFRDWISAWVLGWKTDGPPALRVVANGIELGHLGHRPMKQGDGAPGLAICASTAALERLFHAWLVRAHPSVRWDPLDMRLEDGAIELRGRLRPAKRWWPEPIAVRASARLVPNWSEDHLVAGIDRFAIETPRVPSAVNRWLSRRLRNALSGHPLRRTLAMPWLVDACGALHIDGIHARDGRMSIALRPNGEEH